MQNASVVDMVHDDSPRGEHLQYRRTFLSAHQGASL